MPLGMKVDLSPGDFGTEIGTPPLPKKGAEPLPNFWPMSVVANSWMDQDGTWHGGGPWFRHIVLDGHAAPLPKKGGRAPQFSTHFYCGQRAGCIEMPLGVEVGLSPGDFVFDGDPAPFPKRGGAPQF